MQGEEKAASFNLHQLNRISLNTGKFAEKEAHIEQVEQ
jgi:hypothetical protein